jgi:hypothetical protein
LSLIEFRGINYFALANSVPHSLVLLSANGQEVTRFTANGASIDLEMPTVRPGLYFIQGVCNQHRFTKAFVVDKQ